MENSQNPKLAAIAQCLFDKFGHEITDVHSLKYDQQVWVGYGEAFISPFSKCARVIAYTETNMKLLLNSESTISAII